MSYSLVIDGVIVLLLAVSIYYFVVLNRRLMALRRGEDEMRAKLEEFDAAAVRAERALAAFNDGATGGFDESIIGGEILERAEILRDDLKFLVDRGDALISKTAMAIRPIDTATPGEIQGNAPGSSVQVATHSPGAGANSAPDAPGLAKGLGRIANMGSAR